MLLFLIKLWTLFERDRHSYKGIGGLDSRGRHDPPVVRPWVQYISKVVRTCSQTTWLSTIGSRSSHCRLLSSGRRTEKPDVISNVIIHLYPNTVVAARIEICGRSRRLYTGDIWTCVFARMDKPTCSDTYTRHSEISWDISNRKSLYNNGPVVRDFCQTLPHRFWIFCHYLFWTLCFCCFDIFLKNLDENWMRWLSVIS